MLLKIGYGLSSLLKNTTAILSGLYRINNTDRLLINNAGDKLIIKSGE